MEVNLEEEMNDTGVITQTQTNDNKLLRQEETTKNNGDAVNESFNNNLEMLTADDVKLLTRLDEANLLDNNENSLSALSELLLEQKHTRKPPATTSTLPPIGVSPVYSPSSTTMVTTPEAMTVESPGPSPKMNPPEKKHVKFHPNGGKPMDLNKRMKSSSKARQKAVVYQSQISDNSLGIKLCIKKAVSFKLQPSPNSKSPKKRSRKSRTKSGGSDSDDTYVKRRKKSAANNNNNTDKATFNEPVEQSLWGNKLPKEILFKIFKLTISADGVFPMAARLNRVCSLWRDVSLDPQLWQSLDLSTFFKERNRTETRLKWFIENRMANCDEVNLGHWKITNVLVVLERLLEHCPDLVGISLPGWRALTNDHLAYITENFKKLERLDLSSINMEMNTMKTAVGWQSLIAAIETVNERLTHLHLAHNQLAGVPHLATALTQFAPNLILLDLSNVKTVAASHGVLHIESLQAGCQKLKILRITNSHIFLGSSTLQEQMASPGFPDLEELSVASLADESRLISDETLQRILKTSTKLKLLDVRGCARLTHDSLIRLPAWDLKHLFLSGCSVTRDLGSGLELIASKWAHSLIEFDLAWANVQAPLDDCLRALADKKDESPLNHLNLCGSAVSAEAVKEILKSCPALNSINLSSCRGLPRGIKRLLQGRTELNELRENLGVAQRN